MRDATEFVGIDRDRFERESNDLQYRTAVDFFRHQMQCDTIFFYVLIDGIGIIGSAWKIWQWRGMIIVPSVPIIGIDFIRETIRNAHFELESAMFILFGGHTII